VAAAGIAFALGTLFIGGAAVGHPGSGAFLHSGHSDTMDGTLTAKNFEFKKAKTVRLVVPGSAFIPDASGDTYEHGGYSGEVTPLTGSEMVAPVNLPDDAKVVRVSWFYDESPADDQGELHLEVNFPQGGHDDMALLLSDACAASSCPPKVDTTITPNTINNKTRHYGLWLNDLGGAGELTTYKVVIRYEVGAPGPASGRPLPGATFAERRTNNH
jgi:hypothetical protein